MSRSRRSMMTRRLAAALVGAALRPAAPWAAQQEQPATATQRLDIKAGRSMILTTDFDVKRIAITNPDVADATVVEPREVLIDGRAPGTVSLIIWGDTTRVQYDMASNPRSRSSSSSCAPCFPGRTST